MYYNINIAMPILGGYGCFGRGTILTKSINLPPHDLLKIKIRYVFIDTWENEIIYIYIDDEDVLNSAYNYNNLVNLNLCGQILRESNS